MRSRILPALALLVGAAAGAVAYAQSQSRPGPPPQFDPPRPVPVTPSRVQTPGAALPVSPTVPLNDTPFEDLLAQMEGLHAEKSALAKREQDLAAEIRRRVQKHSEMLSRLGIAPPTSSEVVPPPASAPRRNKAPDAASAPRGIPAPVLLPDRDAALPPAPRLEEGTAPSPARPLDPGR